MIKAKKTLFALLVISTFIFSFSSCAEKMEKEKATEVVAPPQIVPIVEAKNMYDLYSKRRVPLIQKYEDSINRSKGTNKAQQIQQENDKDKAQMEEATAEFDVARYIHYDYETIKNYIAYIEQEAKLANVDISTLRLYFSNYSEDAKNVHPRQNSIMLSPTIKKGDRDYLFYISGAQEQPQAVLLSDGFGVIKANGMGRLIDKNKKSFASILPNLSYSNSATTTSFAPDKSLTMNKGGSAPPPY